MKTKKLKKLAKFTFEEVEKSRIEREARYSLKEESLHNHICEYDKAVSNKISNFILNLIKLNSKISIDYQPNYINIHCNLSQFRKYNSNVPTKEESIDIKIDQNGFKVRKDYENPISYQDPNFLESIRPLLLEKIQKISKESIFEVMDDVLVLTKLSRENNLDEILNDKN